jgi:transcriptional regulator with XRE-family HTH domain
MKNKERVRSYPSVLALDPKRLRALRLNKKFGSQEAFAQYLGIDVRTIGSAERGKRIREDIAAAIARALEEPVGELFDMPDDRMGTGIHLGHRRTLTRSFPGDMNITAILEVARTVGKNGPEFLENVLARIRQDDRRFILLGEAESKMRREKISNRLLSLYYPDPTLSALGLARYVVSVDGQLVETNIAVTRKRYALSVGLKGEQDAFSYVDRSFHAPSPSDEEIVNLVAASVEHDVRVTNNPVFCLQEFDPTLSRSPITFSLATYLEYRLTYGKLEEELVEGLIETSLNPEDAIARRNELLPRRRALLPDVAAISNVSHRLCVGGVNVLFALRRPAPYNDFAFFIGERSDKVASARGVRCLIPSGFHQPFTQASAAAEVSICASVFRELWEELYRGDEVISHDGHVKPDWYFKYPQLGWFRKRNAKFEHEIVSFGLHLKDGGYQFGVLLAVDDPRYWTKYGNDICTNYEFRNTGTHAVAISTKDARGLAALLTDPLCANSSVFVIVEALLRLKALEPKWVTLPQIERVESH